MIYNIIIPYGKIFGNFPLSQSKKRKSIISIHQINVKKLIIKLCISNIRVLCWFIVYKSIFHENNFYCVYLQNMLYLLIKLNYLWINHGYWWIYSGGSLLERWKLTSSWFVCVLQFCFKVLQKIFQQIWSYRDYWNITDVVIWSRQKIGRQKQNCHLSDSGH